MALPFAALGVAEGIARLPLQYPRLLSVLPDRLLARYRSYYLDFDRDVIQYNPACAHYSADLFYTLKPGACTFTTREFAVGFRINSLGVRSDEAALHEPDIVVLGDSQAMGWAVEQDQTFSALVERQTGLRVLNTAVSSFGTAREMKMLAGVDRGRLRYVLLQYCNNDIDENEEFLAHDYVLPIQSESSYDQARDMFARRRKPWLSAYLIRGWLNLGLRPVVPPPPTPESTRHEVSAFVQTLAHAGVSWDGVKLIVFEIDGTGDNNPLFAAELRRQLADDTLPAGVRSAAVLDLAPVLTPDDYRVLDDHMNPKGHQAVASAIVPLLAR